MFSSLLRFLLAADLLRIKTSPFESNSAAFLSVVKFSVCRDD